MKLIKLFKPLKYVAYTIGMIPVGIFLILVMLIKPAWRSASEEKALNAVRRMVSQRKLARAAGEAPLWTVRMAAIDRLTGERSLARVADIAMHDSNPYVRTRAIVKLLDYESWICEAMDGIFCFDFETKDKLVLAEVLTEMATKLGPPLQKHWKEIKKWINTVHETYKSEKEALGYYNYYLEKIIHEFPAYSFKGDRKQKKSSSDSSRSSSGSSRSSTGSSRSSTGSARSSTGNARSSTGSVRSSTGSVKSGGAKSSGSGWVLVTPQDQDKKK
jgi:hypothetical protein